MGRDRWKGMGSLTLQSGEAVYVRCAHSFGFWYVNNLCVNTVSQHFPWSILYLWWGATGRRVTNKRVDIWDGRDQWHKLQGTTKVELVGTHTQERTCLQTTTVFRIRVDTTTSKSETKFKDYLEKDYWEKEKQGWEELRSSQSDGMGQKVLVRKHDDLMCLLARWEVMMMIKPGGVKILTRTALSTVLHPAQRKAMIWVPQ